MLEDWRDYRRYIKSRQDIGTKGIKYYFFCCVPMISNKTLDEAAIEDWLPYVISVYVLGISLVTLLIKRL